MTAYNLIRHSRKNVILFIAQVKYREVSMSFDGKNNSQFINELLAKETSAIPTAADTIEGETRKVSITISDDNALH